MSELLELEDLIEEFRAILSPEVAHKFERLLHTHVGGPMTTVATQVEIMSILAKRDPEKLPEEVANLKEQIKLASLNIRTIVRALASAMQTDEDS